MLHFENQEAKLDLDIICYEIASPYDGDSSDDRNWLVFRATYVEEDLLLKDSNSCLLTYELKDMTAGLKVLGAGIRDSYDSQFTAPYFLFSAWRQGEDSFAVAVSFTLPNTMDENDVAELQVTMDGVQFQELIAQLDKYCKKFPERD